MTGQVDTACTALTPTTSNTNLNNAPSAIKTVFGRPFRRSTTRDDRYDRFVDEDITARPRGYPSLASYVSTDIDGRLYRRFGYVRNRLLLHKQDKLQELEEQLDKLDEEDSKTDPYRLCSRRYDEQEPYPVLSAEPNSIQPKSPVAQPQFRSRNALFEALEQELREYDEMLLREHQIMSIRQPTRKMHRNYFDYIWVKKPVSREEMEYVYRRDDFVALGVQEDGWLGSYTETLTWLLPKVVLKYLLSSKEDRRRSKSESGLQYFSNERTAKLVKAIAGTVMTVLLVLPIVVLYILTTRKLSGGFKIGIMSLFVVAFAIVLATMTRATRHEMFGASAAYCAVLVVFLGNVPKFRPK